MAKRIAPSRVSSSAVLAQLQAAARKGDRTALALAIDRMRTLAYSPRYWEKYLLLLANPLARLVDLLVIKQGEKIARQKGWVRPKRQPHAKAAAGRGRRKAPERRRPAPAPDQPSLFPEFA